MAQTVLVVDDYPDARLLLSYVLEDAGFQVIFAENGPQAIAMAREHRPTAIVMDLHLPGMSGVEATRALKDDAALAGIPIVAHTLSSAPLTPAEHAIFDAVCSKPSSPAAVIEALRLAIRRRAPGPGVP
jgi:CheY-like chemotaxis protein